MAANLAAIFINSVFELFQQLHAPGKYDGNGVGLAICKKIINKSEKKKNPTFKKCA